ncbi:excinuclease ABC subunit UvrC [Zymomonas mobilis]|uniref:excinuclease ABC subunit UvrC n=1 Tax=Zymomonas mobilis TaxID=542 RepID=UPI0009B69CDF|nr:excinuclease ABC subunit UvrC [Zymomonas mobilis]
MISKIVLKSFSKTRWMRHDLNNESQEIDRFSEKQTLDVFKGTDHPDLEKGVAAIGNVLKTLPLRPGVYRMYDSKGNILYVGKARALRNRVANYTQISGLSRRIQRMVSQTRSMTIVTTVTESEALLLEAQLIKRYRPPYNILLRDDKSFPYILLKEDGTFPQFPSLQRHRGVKRAKGKYYGPFASADSVTLTLNSLQKLFLLRSCSDSFFRNRKRPCLLYQIKRCSAPCVGRISEDDYRDLAVDTRDFLAGKSTHVQKKLVTAMEQASNDLNYELAAVYRDRLKALAFIQSHQSINSGNLRNADIFGIECRAGLACIQVFFIRNRQNWGHHAYYLNHIDEQPLEDVMQSFLGQFYEDKIAPKDILTNYLPSDKNVLEDALSSQRDYRVKFYQPQRGELKKLVDQAVRNAKEAIDRRLAEASTQKQLLKEMVNLFHLDKIPDRIEVYDNSHIMGSNMVGGMIVAGPEGFRRNSYRKFNIKSPSINPGDDFEMMREVLTRRFSRLERSDPDHSSSEWPDLLLIDGGKGQVHAVKDILAEQGISDIAIVGISKGPDRNAGREHFHLVDGSEYALPPNSGLLFYLQRLRDEAHRFAIGTHRAKRAKNLTSSPLDEVPGIGPSRKKALLLHFGTARDVKNASLSELEKVNGISSAIARQIYDFFHHSPA